MGYPFEDNPLDAYMDRHFDLVVKQIDADFIGRNDASSSEDRDRAAQISRSVLEELRELKKECAIPARSYDCFRSLAELAIEKFELENPEPPFLNLKDCKHARAQVTKKTFRDGTVHVVVQCQDCAMQLEGLKKGTVEIDALPDFDEGLYGRLTSVRRRWEEARHAVLRAEICKDNDVPEFDDKDFELKYREQNPPPGSYGCSHSHTEPRLRIYSSKNNAVVLQCMTCGHHTGTSSKSNHPNWQDLPLYDDALVDISGKELSEWYRRKYTVWTKARSDFLLDVQARVDRGELVRRDHSRFGTYYQSPEWDRTRSRILKRDDFKCQACLAVAECVHHIVYDRLGAENDLDLISLCNSCHELIHREQRRLFNVYRMPPSEILSMRYQ